MNELQDNQQSLDVAYDTRNLYHASLSFWSVTYILLSLSKGNSMQADSIGCKTPLFFLHSVFQQLASSSQAVVVYITLRLATHTLFYNID